MNHRCWRCDLSLRQLVNCAGPQRFARTIPSGQNTIITPRPPINRSANHIAPLTPASEDASGGFGAVPYPALSLEDSLQVAAHRWRVGFRLIRSIELSRLPSSHRDPAPTGVGTQVERPAFILIRFKAQSVPPAGSLLQVDRQRRVVGVRFPFQLNAFGRCRKDFRRGQLPRAASRQLRFKPPKPRSRQSNAFAIEPAGLQGPQFVQSSGDADPRLGRTQCLQRLHWSPSPLSRFVSAAPLRCVGPIVA